MASLSASEQWKWKSMNYKIVTGSSFKSLYEGKASSRFLRPRDSLRPAYVLLLVMLSVPVMYRVFCLVTAVAALTLGPVGSPVTSESSSKLEH